MAANGKTMSDNAISTLAGEDCRLFRLLKGEWICHPESKVVATAALPPAPPEPPLTVVVSPYPRPADPIVATAEPLALARRDRGGRARSSKDPGRRRRRPSSRRPSPPVLETPSAAPATPAPAPRVAQTAAVAPIRPPATAKSTRAMPPAQQAAVPTTPTPAAARVLGSGPPVRGEMVIQGGTNPAEAEAIAGQLKGFPAKIRPVQKDGVTVYEVVVGLSG